LNEIGALKGEMLNGSADEIIDLDGIAVSPYDASRDRVKAAVAEHPCVELSWRYSAGRMSYPITVDDLASCLVEIGKGDEVRVVTGTFSKPLRRKSGKVKQERVRAGYRRVGFTRSRMGKLLGCPRAKATALMKTLLLLGLTEIVGNHSAGRRGIVYAVVPIGRAPRPRPQPQRRPDPNESHEKVLADPTDNPFGNEPSRFGDVFNIPRDGTNISDDGT
jgi:hypothetical protein